MTNTVIFTNFSEMFPCMLFLNELHVIDVSSDFGAKTGFVTLEGPSKSRLEEETTKKELYFHL